MNTLNKIIKQFFAISLILVSLIHSSLEATVPNLSNLCLNTLQHFPQLIKKHIQNYGELPLEIKEKIQKTMLFANTQTLQEYQKCFSSVSITPDGETIVSAFDDKTVKVFIKQDNDQFKEFQTLYEYPDYITTPDGNTTITKSQYSLAKIWLKQNDGQLSEFKTLHSNWILLFSAATNQNTIVTKSYCNVIVKNYQSRNIQTLHGHTDYILSVAITPDSNTIVSGSKDKTAKVWVKQNNQYTEFQELRGHKGEVYFVGIAHKGDTIVTASKDEVKIWIKPNLN